MPIHYKLGEMGGKVREGQILSPRPQRQKEKYPGAAWAQGGCSSLFTAGVGWRSGGGGGGQHVRPPLDKHTESLETNGQTGFPLRQGRACAQHVVRKVPPPPCQWTPHANGPPLSKEETWPGPLTRGGGGRCSENLPIPHPNQNRHNRAPQHNVQAKFSMLLMSSLPMRGIRSCRMEALSNPAPHRKQLQACALGQALERPWLEVLEWVWASKSLVQSCPPQYLW